MPQSELSKDGGQLGSLTTAPHVGPVLPAEDQTSQPCESFTSRHAGSPGSGMPSQTAAQPGALSPLQPP